MSFYSCHLWNNFIDYFDKPVLDCEVIYTGDVLFQYNEQEDMYMLPAILLIAGNPP